MANIEKNSYKKSILRQNKAALVLGNVLSFVSAGISISIAFVLEKLINVANNGTMEELKQLALMTLGVLAVSVINALLRRTFVHRFYYRGLTNYKNFVFKRLLSNNVNAFGEAQTGRYLSGMTNDVNSIETQYLENIFDIVGAVALFVGGLVSLFYQHLWIGVTVVVSSVLPLSVSLIFRNLVQKREKTVSAENDHFTSSLRDILSGFSVIKSFRAEPEIQKIFDRNDENLEQAKRKRRDTISNVDIASSISGMLMLMIVVGVGVVLSIQNKITAGAIAACIQLMNYITGPVQFLPTALSRRKTALALMQKMENTLEHSEEAERHVSVRNLEQGIRFENVSFGYEENRKILNGVNCFLKKGLSYAIVGVSGSGKTTMLNLLMGTYADYSGNVLLDNQQIKDISMESLYTLMSVVQQNVFIFDDDIISNITMYKSFPQSEIDRAIDYSGLRSLINEKGLAYKCGEGGSRLSGGERQRISIARAILKNMEILLMDEATSSLDNQTAREVEEAILSLNNITRVVVTHKYSAAILRKYDEIIVLREGVVAEQGSFDELLKANGYFSSLYQISGVQE